MAKLLIGIAAAVMLATATLGFLLKGNVDKLQSSLRTTKGTLASTEKTLKTTKTDLEKTQQDLVAATTKVDELGKEIAAQKTQMEDLRKQKDEAATAMAAKTKEYDDLLVKFNEMGKTPGTTVAADDSPALIELKNQLQKAQTEVSEARQIQETLNNRIKDTETRLAASELKEKQRQMQFVRAGLSGRILAVNSGWNFVVLSIGDRQGVIVNAPVLVTRGGEQIARARITSVEPATSIADVIPSSIRKGVTIQPGDTVMFEGRSNAGQPAQSALAPGGTAGALPVR